jgi:hypothetical protein
MKTNLNLSIVALLALASSHVASNTVQVKRNFDKKCHLLHQTSQKTKEEVSRNNEEHLERNDIVQKQYLMLPYPPFTQKDLSDELKYYQSLERSTPSLFAHLIQLEYINHYLFQGKQSFE